GPRDHVVIVVTTDHQVRGEMKILNVPLRVNTCPHLAIHIGGTIAPLLTMTIVVHLGVMKKDT
ncbi:hypothetical protein A2U01_0115147, partial [Trifolium medium]|nr:hypothetical protein [Trifolium medium]